MCVSNAPPPPAYQHYRVWLAPFWRKNVYDWSSIFMTSKWMIFSSCLKVYMFKILPGTSISLRIHCILTGNLLSGRYASAWYRQLSLHVYAGPEQSYGNRKKNHESIIYLFYLFIYFFFFFFGGGGGWVGFVCLFLLLYVPCQQLWSLRDGQFT